MRKFVLLAAVLFIAASVSLTACGSKASDNSKAAKECCGDHKADAKACCDSTKASTPADSSKKAGCCEGEKHKEPCEKPCAHKQN